MDGKRVWELDFLRGLALFLMLFDHLMFDFSILESFFTNFYSDAPELLWRFKESGWWWFNESSLRLAGHYTFATVFLLVTGISYSLSKDNGVRCLRLWCMATVLSLATAIIDSIVYMDATIYFGVLQCMALGLTLILLIDKLIKNNYALLVVGAAIVIVGFAIKWYEMPWYSVSYVQDASTFMDVMLGFVRCGGDHFGFFPSVGVVIIGAYLGKILYSNGKSLLPKLDGAWNKVFCFIGKRTAWIYLLHQPTTILIVVGIGIACGLEVF